MGCLPTYKNVRYENKVKLLSDISDDYNKLLHYAEDKFAIELSKAIEPFRPINPKLETVQLEDDYEEYDAFAMSDITVYNFPNITDTAEENFYANDNLMGLLREVLDFVDVREGGYTHIYNIGEQLAKAKYSDYVGALSKHGLSQEEIIDIYVKTKNIINVQVLNLAVKNGKSTVEILPDNYTNSKNAKKNSQFTKTQLYKIMDVLKKAIGLEELDIALVSEYTNDGKEDKKAVLQETIAVAKAFLNSGYIYINQFADRNTSLVLKFNKYNESAITVFEKILPYYIFYRDTFIALGSPAERYYTNEEIENVKELFANKQETEASKEVMVNIISSTMRSIIDDFGYGNSLKRMEKIKNGDTDTKNTRLVANGKIKNSLATMKRFFFASAIARPLLTKENTFIENEVPDYDGSDTQPVYRKYNEATEEYEVFIKVIFLDTSKSKNLKNGAGLSRLDCAVLINSFISNLFKASFGLTANGIIKNYFYNNGLYFKEAMHQFHDDDYIMKLAKSKNAYMVVNEEVEKNKIKSILVGDKEIEITYTSLEEFEEGKGKSYEIPFSEFNNLKEGSSEKEEIVGINQLANSSNIIGRNKWVDSAITKFFVGMTKNSAFGLNRYFSENTYAKDFIDKVKRMVRPKNIEQSIVYDFYKHVNFVNIFIDEEGGKRDLASFNTFKKYSFMKSIKYNLSYFASDALYNAVKLKDVGTDIVITPDLGKYADKRYEFVKKQLLEIPSLSSNEEYRLKLEARLALKGNKQEFEKATKELLEDENYKEIHDKVFDENGFIKFGYGIITEDVADRLNDRFKKNKDEYKLELGEDFLYYTIPSDSPLSMSSFKIIGILPKEYGSINAFTTNSDYLQTAIGRDFDIDVMYFIPKPKWTDKEEWDNVNEKAKEIYANYINGFYETFKEMFAELSNGAISLSEDATVKLLEGLIEKNKKVLEILTEINPDEIFDRIKNRDIKGIDKETLSYLAQIAEQNKKIESVHKNGAVVQVPTLDKPKAMEYVGKLISNYEKTINEKTAQASKAESKINEAIEYVENTLEMNKPKSLKEKANIIFDEKARLIYMQTMLGFGFSNRDENEVYTPVEKEAINNGKLFQKDIGKVITLREMFNYFSIIKYEDYLTVKSDGREIPAQIDFRNMSDAKWNKIHVMLSIATHHNVDFPKNTSKFYYNSSINNLTLAMLGLPIREGEDEGKGLVDSETAEAVINSVRKNNKIQSLIYQLKNYSANKFRDGSESNGFLATNMGNFISILEELVSYFNSSPQMAEILKEQLPITNLANIKNIKEIKEVVGSFYIYNKSEVARKNYEHENNILLKMYNALYEFKGLAKNGKGLTYDDLTNIFMALDKISDDKMLGIGIANDLSKHGNDNEFLNHQLIAQKIKESGLIKGDHPYNIDNREQSANVELAFIREVYYAFKYLSSKKELYSTDKNNIYTNKNLLYDAIIKVGDILATDVMMLTKDSPSPKHPIRNAYKFYPHILNAFDLTYNINSGGADRWAVGSVSTIPVGGRTVHPAVKMIQGIYGIFRNSSSYEESVPIDTRYNGVFTSAMLLAIARKGITDKMASEVSFIGVMKPDGVIPTIVITKGGEFIEYYSSQTITQNGITNGVAPNNSELLERQRIGSLSKSVDGKPSLIYEFITNSENFEPREYNLPSGSQKIPGLELFKSFPDTIQNITYNEKLSMIGEYVHKYFVDIEKDSSNQNQIVLFYLMFPSLFGIPYERFKNGEDKRAYGQDYEDIGIAEEGIGGLGLSLATNDGDVDLSHKILHAINFEKLFKKIMGGKHSGRDRVLNSLKGKLGVVGTATRNQLKEQQLKEKQLKEGQQEKGDKNSTAGAFSFPLLVDEQNNGIVEGDTPIDVGSIQAFKRLFKENIGKALEMLKNLYIQMKVKEILINNGGWEEFSKKTDAEKREAYSKFKQSVDFTEFYNFLKDITGTIEETVAVEKEDENKKENEENEKGKENGENTSVFTDNNGGVGVDSGITNTEALGEQNNEKPIVSVPLTDNALEHALMMKINKEHIYEITSYYMFLRNVINFKPNNIHNMFDFFTNIDIVANFMSRKIFNKWSKRSPLLYAVLTGSKKNYSEVDELTFEDVVFHQMYVISNLNRHSFGLTQLYQAKLRELKSFIAMEQKRIESKMDKAFSDFPNYTNPEEREKQSKRMYELLEMLNGALGFFVETESVRDTFKIVKMWVRKGTYVVGKTVENDTTDNETMENATGSAKETLKNRLDRIKLYLSGKSKKKLNPNEMKIAELIKAKEKDGMGNLKLELLTLSTEFYNYTEEELEKALYLRSIVNEDYQVLINKSQSYFHNMQMLEKRQGSKQISDNLWKVYKRHSTLYNILRYGVNANNKNALNMKARFSYIPRIYTRESFASVYAYTKLQDEIERMEDRGEFIDEETKTTLYNLYFDEIATKKDPVSPIYHQMVETEKMTKVAINDIQLAYIKVTEDLIRLVNADTLDYYETAYGRDAELYNESKYAIEKTLKIFKNERKRGFDFLHKDVKDLSVGDKIYTYTEKEVINSNVDEETESRISDNPEDYREIMKEKGNIHTIMMATMVEIVEIVGDGTYVVKTRGNKVKKVTIDEITAVDKNGKKIKGKVNHIVKLEEDFRNSKFWQYLANINEIMIAFIRGYVFVYVSKYRNKYGGKITKWADFAFFPFTYKGQEITINDSDKKQKYDDTITQMATLSNTILSMFDATSTTAKTMEGIFDSTNKNKLWKWASEAKELISAIRLFNNSYDAEETLEIIKRLHGKVSTEDLYQILSSNKINEELKAKYNESLSGNEDFQKLLSIVEKRLEKNDSAILSKIDKVQAQKILLHYLKKTFVETRLQPINSIEGVIRLESFTASFNLYYKKTKDFDNAIRFAKQYVKIHNANYDMVDKAISTGTARGRFFNTLSHYNKNRNISYLMKMKQLKNDFELYGFLNLFKDLLYTKKPKTETDALRWFINDVAFNMLLAMFSNFIPGLTAFMSPGAIVAMTVLEALGSDDDEDEDEDEDELVKNEKNFWLIVKLSQLVGGGFGAGVVTSIAYNSTHARKMFLDEDDALDYVHVLLNSYLGRYENIKKDAENTIVSIFGSESSYTDKFALLKAIQFTSKHFIGFYPTIPYSKDGNSMVENLKEDYPEIYDYIYDSSFMEEVFESYDSRR